MGIRGTIRRKLVISVLWLTGVIALLVYSSLQGVAAYRHLVSLISLRASELPLTNLLAREVDDLRFSFRRKASPSEVDVLVHHNNWFDQQRFRNQLQIVRRVMEEYRHRLENYVIEDRVLADRSDERETVARMEKTLDSIQLRCAAADWQLDPTWDSMLAHDLERLGDLTHELPTGLHERFVRLREEVRNRYHTWFAMIGISTLIAFSILIVLINYFIRSVIKPFKILLEGSRKVARGNYEHRIGLYTRDELGELAQTMDQMTSGFVRIRDHLHEEIRGQAHEIARSEQLSSVGFLAAGMSHEINNPLTAIAWSAEALEARLHDWLNPSDDRPAQAPTAEQLELLRSNLRRIHNEAFRCKGILEKVLKFSRLGDHEKRISTDITALVTDVVELIRHLGNYQKKQIKFIGHPGLRACVCGEEIQQVVLNLITNALDSIEPGGQVNVSVEPDGLRLRITVRDNGCGMTDEIKEQLFKPFFTRRRDGRGTGLGLSISHRIIEDHGGSIVPTSDGPGQGSCFVVILPLDEAKATHEQKLQAA